MKISVGLYVYLHVLISHSSVQILPKLCNCEANTVLDCDCFIDSPYKFGFKTGVDPSKITAVNKCCCCVVVLRPR